MSDAYLPHLSDPLRHSIAVRYIQHELRKLFPSLRGAAEWRTIDVDVKHWFNQNPTLAPIRDFWNGVHGISMGFKLKHIAPWLTSLHLAWREEDIPIDDCSFGSTLDEIAAIGDRPTAAAVRTWYFDPEHRQPLAAARRAHEERSTQTMPRDHFPIFVIRREGIFRVHDGNRRLLRAILFEQPIIRAIVGEPHGEPVLFEHWVPTSLLLDLVTFHRYTLKLGRAITESTAEVLVTLVEHSSAGRRELAERCVVQSNPEDVQLRAAVAAALLTHGIAW